MSSVVKIENLSYCYKDHKALNNISLTIPRGKMIGFVGPDGVGKSTLLSIIAGTRKIDSSNVTILNYDMNDRNSRYEACSKIAYMPQGLGKNLYMTLSVYENIEFFSKLFGLSKKEREARINHLLKSTNLIDFKDRAAGKLSGGMKQKLGLCCALIHNPELLILDEPTTGVDPLSRREFWKLVNQIKSTDPNMSVLIATAYMQEAETFDSIIAMDDGKILAYGTLDEILEKTNCDNLDDAFIQLLPYEKRSDHKALIVENRDIEGNDYSIEVANLTMKFNDFVAVDSVSLKIKQGEIFGFLGSNGCGKTTTMKMLTGLLKPTSGTVKIFNEEVKGNLSMKEDVGYMTQNFSLYSELTVYDNLVFHAKLYHIESIEDRVEYLLERFGLKSYKHSTTKDLPLGIKQRLSLAVAVVNNPKMLILDEPTSGVDPISRDSFWQLLISLSRDEMVTIFISTHFMNEAQRCDRISLMHKGKVLVSDSVENIIKSKNKTNLEDAFISYLEDTEESEDKNSNLDLNKIFESKTEQKKSIFSLQRALAYSYKESLELLRDKVRLVFALLGSVILLFVIGYGVSFDIENLNFAVLDQDRSPLSQDYIQNISGSRYFIQKDDLNSFEELEYRMKSSDISLAYVIPPEFGKNLLKGDKNEISVWIDGTFPFRAENIKGYTQGLHYKYIQSYYKENFGVDLSSDLDIVLRYRYNQDFKSIYSIVPAVIPLLLIFIPSILMAVSIVREKELGSIVNFYSTPVKKLEFLFGKQLPYIVISMISFAILMLCSTYIFNVPIKGGVFTLTFGVFLYVIATTSIGLFMSSFVNTQIAALTGTAILTLLPSIQFSGLKEPVSSLEGVARFIGDIFPATYFINISRGVLVKDVSFRGFYFEFFALFLAGFIIIFLSYLVLQKQDRG